MAAPWIAALPENGQGSDFKRFEPPPLTGQPARDVAAPVRAPAHKARPEPAEKPPILRPDERPKRKKPQETAKTRHTASSAGPRPEEPRRTLLAHPAPPPVLLQQILEMTGEDRAQLPTEAQMRARQYADAAADSGRLHIRTGRYLRLA